MSEVSKRIRIDTKSISAIDELGVKFETRLSAMEKKMEFLMSTCSAILNTCEKLLSKEKHEHDCCATLLLPKILYIDDYLRNLHKTFDREVNNESNGTSVRPVVLLSSGKVNYDDNADPNVHILTLNTENDIPEGSWLGDSSNPAARVRVDIPPTLLMHINAHCLTPEKMALTLLDCLFPRDILAVSNLSGKGKHSKRQLDPLLIYAIRCHLVYKFNITEKDWHRIKQNIDSKCRSAWRKKISVLPLGTSSLNTNIQADPLSEESSDGVTNTSSIKILCNNGKYKGISSQQQTKVFTDEELKELLPSPVELFSVVDSECFTLGDQALVIQEGNDNSVECPDVKSVIIDDD